MSGDLAHLLVSKIISTGSLKETINAGVKPAHLTKTWEERFQWLLDYTAEHGTVPTERAWASQYGSIEILHEDVEDEPFSGLISEIMESYKERVVINATSDAMAQLDKDNTAEAIRLLTVGLQEASVDPSHLRDVDTTKNWQERLDRYEEMRSNRGALYGIPTGFHTLDRITFGLRPQQYIVAGGEPKTGKSTLGLIIAESCHAYGKKPGLISFEMSNMEQQARQDAINSRVPLARILSGNLSDNDMKALRESMNERKAKQPFWMSEDSHSLTTISALAAKIQEHSLDLLVVDGVYLMDDEHGETRGSPAALTNVSRGLKRLAQRFNIPVFATTQVLAWKVDGGRKPQRGQQRVVTVNSFGYSSAFGQDADILLAVERDQDIDDQSVIRVVEARQAARMSFKVHWDWKNMDFEEVDDYVAPDSFYD